jgi:NAD(P)-dependent dehydrogenase (short-subunit alcohol dehydrogenase family)
VAIVTGSNRNIGAAIARRLAADGAAVVVNYPHPGVAVEARAVVDEIAAAGGRAVALGADVSDETEVEQLAAGARETFGPVDLLVNNAAVGVSGATPWREVTVAEWSRVLAVNLLGAFLCARAVYPDMLTVGRGDIVSVSSVTALFGRAGNIHYVASKAALLGFTRTLAREVGPCNVRVNCIVPGAIETPDEAVYGDPAELAGRLVGLQSLKRRGHPSDIAGVVSVLVSDDASFVTGQSVVVDGGWVMR